LAYELRHTLRFLVRNRVFSLTAALLIALGVGANTTVFTLVNAVMLRAPRGIEAPDRLAQVGRGGTDARDFDSWSYPLFADFRARNTVFTDLAAYETREVTLGRNDDVQSATAQLVSANYFRVLGVRLARGRGFLDEEEREGGPWLSSLAISHGGAIWRRRERRWQDVGDSRARVSDRRRHRAGFHRCRRRQRSAGRLGSARRHGDRIAGWYGALEQPVHKLVWIAGRLKPGVDARAAQATMRPLFRQIQLDAGGEVRDDLLVVPGLDSGPPSVRSQTW
jgi:hypothetical protein